MDVRPILRHGTQVRNLVETETWRLERGYRRPELHERTAICLRVARGLESRCYTGTHQLQSER